MVQIELSVVDVGLFKHFQQYYPQFIVLLQDGIFDDFIGSATIHKNGPEIKIVQKTVTIQH